MRREIITVKPCDPASAVPRAMSLLDKGGAYELGTGDYRPHDGTDLPWTTNEKTGRTGCDCAGLICWAYELIRHRPGYNKGGRFDVEGDLNCNSMIGDAVGACELFTLVTDAPKPGDVIAYPSFYLYDSYGRPFLHEGKPLHWIGHTGLVVSVGRVSAWDPSKPHWSQLDIVQVHGPDERSPAATLTDGSVWAAHDWRWPKEIHRSHLIRPVA